MQDNNTQPQILTASELGSMAAPSVGTLQTMAAVNPTATNQFAAQMAASNQQNAMDYINQAQKNQQEEMKRRGISYVIDNIPISDTSKPVWDKSRPVLDEEGNPVLDEDGTPKYEQAVDENGALVFEPLRDAFGNIRYNKVTRITGVPDHEQWLAAFFATTTPCWFPECEALRGEFQEQLASRAKQLGAASCPMCQQGAIMRAMREKVLPIIMRVGPPPMTYGSHLNSYTTTNSDNGHTQTIPGAGKPSGPAAANAQPGNRKRGLLRKALDRVAAYLGYSPNA